MNLPFSQRIAVALLLCGTGALSFGQAEKPELPAAMRKPALKGQPDGKHVGHCGARAIAVDAPVGFEPASGDFNIVPTFDPNLPAAERLVLQYALNEWLNILQSRGINPGEYPITLAYGTPSNPSFLAETVTTYRQSDGALIQASMVFDPSETWFIDSSPWDDSEFASTPPDGFDLLSVARHELGHALGWIGSGRVTGLISGGSLDPARLNIGMAGGNHADPAAHPGELMEPGISSGERRPIRLYPSVALISRVYQQEFPMRFVDPLFGGGELGTAWAPWRTLPVAAALAPANIPILLAPGTHHVPRGQALSTPHPVQSARGGATVTAP